jgi:hypothetical protein
VIDDQGRLANADSSLRSGELVSVIELPSMALFVGFGEDAIPPADRELLLLHRLHMQPAPPCRPHQTLVCSSKATQKLLARLQCSAVSAESVFFIWQSHARLNKLLKWFPKTPFCPSTKSFIVRFLHKKAFLLHYPSHLCPSCGNAGGFDHEQYQCPLSMACYVHFCRQMSSWLALPMDPLFDWIPHLIVECPADKPYLSCWNVAIWLLRRALFSTRCIAEISNCLATIRSVLTVWRTYLSEFIAIVSRSKTHARKYACRGAWMEERLPEMFTPVVTFLPLPL